MIYKFEYYLCLKQLSAATLQNENQEYLHFYDNTKFNSCSIYLFSEFAKSYLN